MFTYNPKNGSKSSFKGVFCACLPLWASVLILGVLAAGGCGDVDSEEKGNLATHSSPQTSNEPAEPVIAIDSYGRPWKKGPEIKSQWPDDPRVDIALKLIESRNYSDAQIVLETILAQKPNIGRARFLLGIVLQKQKQYEAALANLDMAVKMDQPFPESLHAEHFMGWCLFNLGRLEDARAAFTDHVAQFPEEGDSHFGLGIVAIDQGNFGMAKTSLEKAIALQKDVPRRAREVAKAHARLGDVYLAEDALEDARSNYHTAVIRWPDHYEAWAKLARTLDRLEKPVQAERARKESDNARRRMGRTVDDAPVGSSSP